MSTRVGYQHGNANVVQSISLHKEGTPERHLVVPTLPDLT